MVTVREEKTMNHSIEAVFQEGMRLLLDRAKDEDPNGVNVNQSTVYAIQHCEAILTDPIGGGCICGCPVIDGHTGTCPVVHFLPEHT